MSPSIEHEAEFERLIALPDAVLWTMSLGGEITYVSESVRKVRGYSPEEAMRQGGDEIHPPESLRTSLRYFERLSQELRAGRTPEHFRGTLDYRCADGSTVRCTVVAGLVVTQAGDPVELRGVSLPIAAESDAAIP